MVYLQVEITIQQTKEETQITIFQRGVPVKEVNSHCKCLAKIYRCCDSIEAGLYLWSGSWSNKWSCSDPNPSEPITEKSGLKKNYSNLRFFSFLYSSHSRRYIWIQVADIATLLCSIRIQDRLCAWCGSSFKFRE